MTKHKHTDKSGNSIPQVTVEELASTISSSHSNNQRIIVAIAGPPGSGKSTTADLLCEALEKEHCLTAQVVPMDGFHYDNTILQQIGLSHRKGSPQTFDVGGLASTLKRLSSSYQAEDVAIPIFDRDIDLSRGSARLVMRDTAVLLVEGNYLIMDDARWSNLTLYFDLSVMISCDESALRTRLMKRWLDLDYSEIEAVRKVEENDLPNAIQVIKKSNCPDYVMTNSF